MAKTALITGATGLLGRQVVKAFTRAGWEVKGTGYTRASPPTILKLDLGSEADVAKTLEDVKWVNPGHRNLNVISADRQEDIKTAGRCTL
jgi:NAD(P)-dependent dehydrogenase (short-subunit alcohol dehydrogenase family)